ncbi:MAG TPA: preprotein translocase subunit SecG [Polyangiaceae bacterium]|jgi:preprotein translocase subunit SecG
MAEIIETPLTVIHIVACAFLILVILVQPGKSGGVGAFTGAAATQVFGGGGAGNILTKITWVTGTIFFLSSITLAYLSSSSDEALQHRARSAKTQQQAPAPARPAVPGKPAK